MSTSSTSPTQSGDSDSRSGRALAVALLALVLVLLAPVALMGLWMAVVGVAMPFPMMGGRTPVDGAPVWFAVVGLLGQLLWVAALLAVGYLLYRAVTSGGGRDGRGGDRADPALEELRLAYARGEVNDEEYERRRERLLEE